MASKMAKYKLKSVLSKVIHTLKLNSKKFKSLRKSLLICQKQESSSLK